MEVVVIGAGPGGLATAVALRGLGHEVAVYERAPSLRLGGSAVTMWPNGLAVLEELGVPLEGLGPVIDVLDGRDHRGRPLLQMRTAALVARFGAPAMSVQRGRLVQRLASALPPDVVRFSAVCTGVDPAAGLVTFVDGGTARGDVVVGADGRDSAVRAAVRPDARSSPTGWATWQGLSAVDIDVIGSSRILTLLGPGGFVGLQPAGEGLLQWYFSVPPSAGLPASAHEGAVVDMLRARFAGWADPVPAVLRAIADTSVTPWEHHTLRITGPWGAGRVTLLGDAAHAMPPSLAQGVNQTLEDVHALTTALAGPTADTDLDGALRRYEGIRAGQVRRISAMTASESSTTYRRSTNLLMRAMPPRVATATYNTLISRASSVLAHRLARA